LVDKIGKKSVIIQPNFLSYRAGKYRLGGTTRSDLVACRRRAGTASVGRRRRLRSQ
jgi:hypothetical protein